MVKLNWVGFVLLMNMVCFYKGLIMIKLNYCLIKFDLRNLVNSVLGI